MFTNTVPEMKYDVFVSFRGVDTRDNFTSHLFSAFQRENIETFIDEKLDRGDEILQSLLNAIKQSKISVVIFSQGYAASRWCLEELVKILKCKNKYGQMVIPTFYHVDPSHVRNQTGNFGDEFSKLEERFKEKVEKLQKWRNALTEVAKLSGFDSQVIRSESVLVQKIVEVILERLNDMFPNEIDKDLVGVGSHIKEIESLLSYGSNKDVYTLGIWGAGGIGKTRIAGAVFNKISNHFDGSYFLENVREKYENNGGLSQLQRELLSSLLGDGNLNIGNPIFNFNFACKRLRHKKVLIVFDDVTHFNQIEFLIESLDRFMPGSLIIITTRNKQVLRNCQVKKIYEMKKLVYDSALRLFSWHAFKRDHPDVGYEQLSIMIMQYAQGIPLALKVLGCLLCKKEKEDWKSAINKLKRIPNSDIQKVLEASYDSLDKEEKIIFLDIACFFNGSDKDFVIQFLDGCGFSAKIGISSLIDKGLIIISNKLIIMHNLLQEMGKEIVQQESENHPEKCSRLWEHEDISKILEGKRGTEAIQGISLNMSKIEEINLNLDTFKRINNLRFLRFYGENKFNINDFGSPGCTFHTLRYLCWEGYPLKSLPSNIRPQNLVLLKLPNSEVEQLWEGVQNLVNLKEIDLEHSKHLTKLPDLSKAQNLEKLKLGDCSSLVETHSSLEYLNKLVILDLNHCKSLKSLPKSIGSKSLELLYLSECSNLKRCPELLSCNVKELRLYGTTIKELPSSIEYQSRLVQLTFDGCSRLESLPNGLCKIKYLEYLSLSECSNLQRLPDELENLQALRWLHAERTAIREIPSSLGGLRNLTFLYLVDSDITELPESLGQLYSLQYLGLAKNNFKSIPGSIINLSKLERLHLSYCQRLQSLPKLPSSVTDMVADHCTSLEVLSGLSILFKLPTLDAYSANFFRLINCCKLDGDELKKIVEEAPQKIQFIANLWWNDRVYVRDQVNINACKIIFPGSEIPELFKHQSIGSSITLELPLSDEFIVGFAFCVVVAFEKHHYNERNFNLQYQLKLKVKDDNQCYSYEKDCFVGRSFDYVDLDHVLLGYRLSTEIFLEFLCAVGDCNEVFLEFYFTDHSFKLIDCCKVVKKCGIHFLYAQEFGESMEDHSTRNFSTNEEEEEEEEEGEGSTDEEEEEGGREGGGSTDEEEEEGVREGEGSTDEEEEQHLHPSTDSKFNQVN